MVTCFTTYLNAMNLFSLHFEFTQRLLLMHLLLNVGWQPNELSRDLSKTKIDDHI